MSTAEPAISVTGLEKEYRSVRKRDRVTALNGIDFAVSRGEVVALLGPNGSGKSTTIKLLLGLLRPSAGKAFVLGKPAGHRATLRRVGYLPEETRLFPFLTAEETLRFFGSVVGLSRKDRAEAARVMLEDLDLAAVARRRSAGFSKGMTRRLGLGAALMGDPELLILDEPTSGLDPLASAEVKDRILGLKAAGRTVLLSSHLLADVEGLCDRVAILGRGELMHCGPADDLLELRDEFEVRFKGGGEGFAERVREFAEEGGATEVTVRHPREDLHRLFLRIFESPRS
jgi:ABC-2 type transport system ATP-binding protein